MAVDYSKSIQHLQSYPVVADTYDYVSNYYTWAKEKSGLVNYTCGLAESGIVKVTSPLVKKFEPQVKAIDDAANNQLNRLDSRFPIVKKPTEELWKDGKVYYEQTVTPKIDVVRKPIAAKYNSVRSTLHSGKELSVKYAKQAIDTADYYVDAYLPSDSEEIELSSSVDDDTPKVDANVSARSKAVLGKTQRRLYRRGKRSAAEMQRLLQNAVTNVVASVGLLETLQAAQAGLGDLNEEFWNRLEVLQENCSRDELVSDGSEMALSDTSSQQSTDSQATVENRVLSLAAKCVRSANQVLTVLSDMVYYRLDVNNKDRWDHVSQSALDFYVKLKESPQLITSMYLRRIRELFNLVGETVESGFRYASGKVSSRKSSQDSTIEKDEEKTTELQPEENDEHDATFEEQNNRELSGQNGRVGNISESSEEPEKKVITSGYGQVDVIISQ